MTRKRQLPRASDLPALAAFARGYLHQDVIAEYGSAVNAAVAFVEDASDEERQRLLDDLERLTHAADGKSMSPVTRFFTDELRAAWTPTSLADLRSLIAAIKT